MKLRRIRLLSYRSFVDQTLELDPNVTIIVGRNDTGKTSFLERFFDQYVYEHAIHSADRPQVADHRNQPIGFSLVWDVSAPDYPIFSFPTTFGTPAARTLEIRFQDGEGPIEHWAYLLDGQSLPAYAYRTPEGWPVLDPAFSLREILPRPHYISIGRVLQSLFEMRLYELPEGTVPAAPHARPQDPARLLLRLADFAAHTRPISGHGIEEPWPALHLPRPTISLEYIEARLLRLSDRITQMLQRWWHDPPGLRFLIKLAGSAESKNRQHQLNSYLISWNIVDESGLPYFGAGLLWFMSFVVELLFLETQERPLLLLFDEPGTPLHPAAQRSTAKLLTSLSRRHQVIYSTHSPFMIDWNFPQRLRLFIRDSTTKQTHIENKPYAGCGPLERIWDPLRSTVGVSLGDIVVLGDNNVLVEGISDQILLANASAVLEAAGRRHLDLTRVSILPYGNETVLRQLVATARHIGSSVVVIADTDQQGRKVMRYCEREGIRCIEVGRFAEQRGIDASIEDLVGVAEYVAAVNRFYVAFDWFTPLDADVVARERGNASLGAYLESTFSLRFEQDFGKTLIAVSLADQLERMPEPILGRFETMIADMA